MHDHPPSEPTPAMVRLPASIYRWHAALTCLVMWMMVYTGVDTLGDSLASQLIVIAACAMIGVLIGQLVNPPSLLTRPTWISGWLVGAMLLAAQWLWLDNLLLWVFTPPVTWCGWVQRRWSHAGVGLFPFWWRAALLSLFYGLLLILLLLLALFIICSLG